MPLAPVWTSSCFWNCSGITAIWILTEAKRSLAWSHDCGKVTQLDVPSSWSSWGSAGECRWPVAVVPAAFSLSFLLGDYCQVEANECHWWRPGCWVNGGAICCDLILPLASFGDVIGDVVFQAMWVSYSFLTCPLYVYAPVCCVPLFFFLQDHEC